MNDRAAPAVATPVPDIDASTSNAATPTAADTSATAVADRTLRQRLERNWPYFADCRRGFVLAVVGALVAAATEPAIPRC